MKFILAIFMTPLLALSQPKAFQHDGVAAYEFLNRYLLTENMSASTQRFTKFVDRLAAKSQAQNEQLLLHQLFVKTHGRFLSTFKQSATFYELFSNGNYNCLTATAVFGVALQRLGYEYSIVETTHHIFILVETDRGKVLLETTDPFKGFVTDAKVINERILHYKNARQNSENAKVVQYQFQTPVFNTVSLENIIGLLHFNLSVSAYNKNNLAAATQHLEEANAYYRSTRVIELSDVIALTLKEKNTYDAVLLMPRLQHIKRTSANTIARVKNL